MTRDDRGAEHHIPCGRGPAELPTVWTGDRCVFRRGAQEPGQSARTSAEGSDLSRGDFGRLDRPDRTLAGRRDERWGAATADPFHPPGWRGERRCGIEGSLGTGNPIRRYRGVEEPSLLEVTDQFPPAEVPPSRTFALGTRVGVGTVAAPVAVAVMTAPVGLAKPSHLENESRRGENDQTGAVAEGADHCVRLEAERCVEIAKAAVAAEGDAIGRAETGAEHLRLPLYHFDNISVSYRHMFAQDRSHLIDRFSDAGLGLAVSDVPIRRVENDRVFQMDIEKARGARFPLERFRIWAGGPDNRLEVLDSERELRQLTLFVQEPRRRYERTEARSRWSGGSFQVPSGERVVRSDDRSVTVEGWTPVEKRRYLCGFDERHLFIARFKEGSSVRDAHRSLDPVRGAAHASMRPALVVRQGEWFFVPATTEEEKAVENYARDFPYQYAIRQALASGRRPHVVDELVRVVPRPGGVPIGPITESTRFARGRVRHVEHATVDLGSWHKVLLNLEPPETQGAGHPLRSMWVD